MKLLYPSLFATALGGNIQAGSLKSNCNLNGQTEVVFNYEPADADLGFAFVGASNSTTCGHGTNQATLTKTNDQLGSYSLTFDRFYCGYDGDVFRQETEVSFSEGKVDGSNFLALRRQRIGVTCDFGMSQTVRYDFNMEKTLEEYDATATSTGGIVFAMEGYTDAERTSPLDPSVVLYTGTPVFMTIKADVNENLRDSLLYVPRQCSFFKTDSDGVSNRQTFQLFDHNVDQCQQAFTDLAFDLQFQPADRTWDLTYKLFTFGENVQSQYTLECDLYACYSGSGNSDQCKGIAQVCDDDYDANSDIWDPPASSSSTSAQGELIMKIGKTNMFRYESPYWEDDNLLNENADSTTEEDAKFATFLTRSFNKITVCYNSPTENCWSYTFNDGTVWDSAKQLFSSGYNRRSDFAATVTELHATLQQFGLDPDMYQGGEYSKNCAPQRPGFNSMCNGGNYVRFGYCNNLNCQDCQPNDSDDADGVIGIGIRGQGSANIVMADGSSDLQAGAGFSQMFALQVGDFACTDARVNALSAFVYVDTV